MQRYESYKPSGIQWVERIPSHWGLKKSKFLWREKEDRSLLGDEELLSVSQYSGVVPRAEDSRSESLEDYKRCEPNDLVINIMLAWMSGLGVSKYSGIVSPAYCVYSQLENHNPSYFDYLYRTPQYLAEFARRSKGIVPSRWRMYTEDFGQILSLLPPREEQDRIVAFLDQKTAEIDAAIAKKERLIELLDEQKQGLIDQAVTVGKSLCFSLQKTEIPGLSAISSGWSLRKLKHACQYQEGPGIMASDFKESGVPLIRIAGVKEAQVSLEGCNFLSELKVKRRWDHFRLNRGDLLISGSASSGTVSEVTAVAEGAVAYTGLFRITLNQQLLEKDFAKLYFASSAFNKQMDLFKTGVGLQHFGPSHLSRAWIALPALNEQKEIVEFVAERAICIDELISATEKVIDSLHGGKKSLIASVVLGQVKV